MKKLIIGTLTLTAFLFISTASIAQEKAEDKQATKQTRLLNFGLFPVSRCLA